MGLRDKRAFRFSIAALLFLMLCLGGYLTGYRVGFQAGKQDAGNTMFYVKTYPVGDLVASTSGATTSPADFDSLIDLLVTTVSPNSWMENGTGDAELQPFPSNKSLVISQSELNHAKVAAFLAGLRKLKSSIPATTPN